MTKKLKSYDPIAEIMGLPVFSNETPSDVIETEDNLQSSDSYSLVRSKIEDEIVGIL